MRKKLAVLAVSVIVVGSALALFGTMSNATDVTLYKNPQCGCCEGYADYLRDNGFTVTVKPTQQLVAMSRDAGIPEDFMGCHLSLIEGYAVSGHVPVNTFNRLLRERPDIKGITLPDMPEGSPGMLGRKAAPFKIYEISPGAPRVYAVE
jgi:hypothetical protein